MDGKKYQEILEYELITAMGCTEPIAIAFVAAKAADILGGVPDKMRVRCSGNIIKNVHGVIIPNTANKRGICVAAIAGALVGHAERNLDVLESMNKESIEKIDALLHSGMCSEERLETETNLAIDIIAQKGDDTAEVRLRESHTNITYIEKNGITIYEAERLENDNKAAKIPDSSTLSIRGIYEYAHQCDTDRIEPLLNRQISYNIAIAEEGIRNGYGAEVGRTILAAFGSSLESQAIAYAAAGSDARMGGCTMPVVINSGSGNQGLTIALPISVYAKALNVSETVKYRALIMANLIAVHVKSRIGRLSAFCGAVSAASAVSAAVTYMYGGSFEQVERAIEMTLATAGGLVCDGAKSSCAAKIAVSLSAAFLSSKLALSGKRFHTGEGLVKDNVEATIACIGSMATDGMRDTDTQILRLMLDES